MELLAAVLAGFVLAPLAPGLTRALGRAAGWVLALVPAGIFAILAGHWGEVTGHGGGAVRAAWEWIPSLGIGLSLSLDGLSLLFGLLISGIGALVFVYAGAYMEDHPHTGRLLSFLSMFMASMLGLALSDNLLALFVFWELTSLSSYLLIGFDHTKEKARKAAWQALLVTASGGLALLAGFVLLGQVAGTYEISELVGRADLVTGHELYPWILGLVLAGAFTKSAQFPFHFWLPSAMEAPTPVSAYLHSSTMVKAGVFLLARLSPVLGGTEAWTIALSVAGGLTALVGGYLAFRESQLKRLLAYTTVSALGFIVLGLGVGSEQAVKGALAFLLAHALYKGALFMAAGAIDHATGEKDVEKLGGLAKATPLLFAASAIAGLSMAGFIPTFGFVSKESLLMGVVEAGWRADWLTAAFVLAAAFNVMVALMVGFKPFLGERAQTPREPHEPGAGLLLGPLALASLGLGLPFLAGALTEPLIGAAASATLAKESEAYLAIWHGVTKELALSGVSLAIGVGIFVGRGAILRALSGVNRAANAVGPARAYEVVLEGVARVADGQTRALQTGSLRFYICATVATAVGLVGTTLALKAGPAPLPDVRDARPEELLVASLIMIGALAAATAATRLAAVAALGLVGYSIAIVYVLFGAPDLAITQFCVETLTVILFVLVFYHLPDFRSLSKVSTRLRDLGIAAAFGAVMGTLTLVAAESRRDHGLAEWFLTKSYPEGHGRNVVNVILVDFRAMDTLGEITVLAASAIGVLALFKLAGRPAEEKAAERRRLQEGRP